MANPVRNSQTKSLGAPLEGDTSFDSLRRTALAKLSSSHTPKDALQFSKEWASNIRGMVGLDDGTESCREAVLLLAKDDTKRLPPHLKTTALEALSESIQSQLPLAEKIEELKHSNVVLSSAEELLKDIKLISLLRANISGFFEFITGDGSLPRAESGSAQCRPWLNAFESSSSIKAEQFYNSFWSLSGSGREALLGKILGPENKFSFLVGLNPARKWLLERFLPPSNTKAAPGASASEIGDKIITSLVRNASYEQLKKMTAALLFAIRSGRAYADRAPAVAFGYRFGFFLRECDSVCAKFGQLFHSVSRTPKDWLEGLDCLKSEAKGITRVELLRLLATNSEAKKHIARVTEYCGTGSYLQTYGIELTEASRTEFTREGLAEKQRLVVSVVKPGAVEESEGWLKLFNNVCDDIAKTSSEAHRSVNPLQQVLRHLETLVPLEVNLSHAKKQAEVANSVLNRLRVKVRSLKIEFFAPRVWRVGETFKIADRAEGESFNALITKPGQDTELTHTASLGIRAGLIALRLAGLASDGDPHGRNNNIEFMLPLGRVRVGIFDNGSQELENPGTETKLALVDLLMDSRFNSWRNRFRLGPSLKYMLTRYDEARHSGEYVKGNDLRFMINLGRQLGSLGDYEKVGRSGDIKRIAKALLIGMTIDPPMLRHAAKRLLGWLSLRIGIPIYKQEELHRRLFYPQNPNPDYAPSPGGKKPKTKEKYPAIDLSVSIEGQRKSILGILGKLAASLLVKI